LTDIRPSKENHIHEHTSGAIEDREADAQSVIEHALTGKPLDPEVARRVRERSELATDLLRRKHGMLDIAVDLIREVRDQE
jgi:hypothetical protein